MFLSAPFVPDRTDKSMQQPTTTVTQAMMSLVWSVYVPSFIFALADGVTLPIVPLFARELTSSDALVGVVLSASMNLVW